MPQTLTQYFEEMQRKINALENCELTPRESEVQQKFLQLCDDGKLLEKKGITYTLSKEGEEKLTKDTDALFTFVGDLGDKYQFNTNRLKQLAHIYFDETTRLYTDHYQYHWTVPLTSKKISRPIPDDKKPRLKNDLDKIERSLQYYQNPENSDSGDRGHHALRQGNIPFVDGHALSDSEESLVVPVCSFESLDANRSYGLALQNFRNSSHTYHAQRALLLYVALVACLTKKDYDGMRRLLNDQLARKTVGAPRSGWSRLQHFWRWRTTCASLDNTTLLQQDASIPSSSPLASTWAARGVHDDFAAQLKNLLIVLT